MDVANYNTNIKNQVMNPLYANLEREKQIQNGDYFSKAIRASGMSHNYVDAEHRNRQPRTKKAQPTIETGFPDEYFGSNEPMAAQLQPNKEPLKRGKSASGRKL